MGKKSDPPPAPDYGPIAAASAESARYSAEIAREQLAWARETYNRDKAVSDRVVDKFLKYQDENATNARKDRARYEQVFQPLEKELVADARSYTDARNAQRAEAAAGRATADVSQQFELARTAAQDRLESFGIDPSQTRSGALDVSARIAEATARAGAANTTREAVRAREEATGRALRSEAINVGRGLPGQIASSYGAALQAGTGAVNTGNATTQTGAGTMGTGLQWTGQSNNALGQWGTALNMGFQNQLDAYKAEQSQSSGWGQALGMVAGIGTGMFMPGLQRKASSWMGFEEGGVVPEHASPSRGAAIDDVAVDVRGPAGERVAKGAINVGEFIVPDDVVKWKGEEFFQKLIQKSREAKPQAPARPQVRGLPVTPQGNPARAALPVG